MSSVYVGTAYHQVYKVPLDQKQPIVKYGQKKKCPVTCIHICPPNSQNQNSIFYSDTYQSFEVNTIDNDIVYAERFVGAEKGQKIIAFEYLNDKRIYYTNHGDIYYKGKDQKQWNKLYYNETYANVIKSLPPQRAGKLPPEYIRVLMNRANKMDIGFVGRGVLPFIYCVEDRIITWKARNVANDELDLQIPPNDIDLCFLNAGYHMAVAHQENKVRIYDIKSRRKKPIQDITLTQIIKAEKVNLTKLTKSACQKYLYVGNHKGSIYELDTRKNLAISAKIKGITTTIKDMLVFDQYLAAVSLDGYLRIFDITTKEKQYERYLNIHPQVLTIGHNGIVFPNESACKIEEVNLNNQNEQQEAEQQQVKRLQKMKKIRKRNKVGLKYLEVSNFGTEAKKQEKVEQAQRLNEMKHEKNEYSDEE